MKLHTVCVLFVIACVLPGGFTSRIFYREDAPILTQYYSQDELGDYSFGYNDGLISGKRESRSNDGITRDFYRFIDKNTFVSLVGTSLYRPSLPSQSVPLEETLPSETPDVAKIESEKPDVEK